MTETLAGRFAAREHSRGYVPALASAAPAAAGALGIAALGAANGGYFPESWSWGLLICVWILVAFVITTPALEVARLDGVLMGALAGLAVVTLVSGTWGSSSLSLLEGQRSTFYAALAAACLVLVRRRTLGLLLGGVLAGIVVVVGYSLLERLAPNRFGEFDPVAGYRLAGTIGYWNGLGIFAAIGILLALGLAARGRLLAVRALAAGSLVVLAPTLYFTFSRGAWIALGIGLLAAIALDPRRLQLIVTGVLLAPAPVVAVVVASRSEALTHRGSRLPAAVHEGHRLALVLALLATAAALIAIGLGLAERRIVPCRGHRLAFAGAVTAFAVVAVALTFVRFGGPVTIAQRAYDGFKAPPAATGTNLNERLFSFSGNGRADLWHAAWGDYVHHPWLGSGAASYERWWLQHRPTTLQVRDAHNVYLETLAELGPLGLLLVLGVVLVPLAAAVRARAHPLVPTAAGAFSAWAVHAGIDWDWELAAVTSAGLLCGCALLVAARRDERTWEPSLRTRAAVVTALVALGGLTVLALVGNTAVRRAYVAADVRDWHRSATEARKATHWMPWSAEPWRLLGEARLAVGGAAPAEAALRAALAKDDQDWLTWFDLAAATSGAERRHALAEVRRLNPRSPEVRELFR